MTTARTLTAALLLTWLSACGSATMIQRDARGGTLHLTGSYGFATGDARSQALEHCQGRYESVEDRGTLTYRCLGPHSLAHASRR